MLRRCFVFALALFASPLYAQSEQSVKSAVASITPEEIIRRIGVIADDSMRGRATPSPELEKTAAFIAGEFRKFGLKPGGDSGRFLQRYELKRIELDTIASQIAIAGGPTLRFPGDALSASGPRDGQGSGKVVILTGTTIDRVSAQSLGLTDAVVLIPLSPSDPTGTSNPLGSKLGIIRAERPAAILFLSAVADAFWQRRAAASRNPMLAPAWQVDAVMASGLITPPIVMVRESAWRPVLEKAGVDLATLRLATGAAIATRVDLTMSVTLKLRRATGESAPNVVGVIEGQDPILKNEYIVFSGHMDHIGVGAPNALGDSVNNGADDDASGTIAVVQLAQAFAKLNPKPKRSLVFLTVSGEERGLWGSEYFAMHPNVPVSQIVANFNTDMVGRNWKDTIVAIGKEHSDLGTTLNRVNAEHPELGMTAIDDIWPQEQFYRRSDHFNFAVRGVPILFFFNGVHADYHRPGDEVSKIDAEKESRIVKLVFYLGLDVANAARKPEWNPRSYQSIVRPQTP